jgi:hypothetical protein
MDIYRYNKGLRRSFKVFMAFIMEIVRILNGFKAFNVNTEEIYESYGYLPL